MEIIALDAHKRYSQVCVQEKDGRFLCEKRINHGKGQISEFLSQWTAGSAVALETVGNWYWIVDEIEQAEMRPKLVHAHKAKLMLGSINKTDKLDARIVCNRQGLFQQYGFLRVRFVTTGSYLVLGWYFLLFTTAEILCRSYFYYSSIFSVKRALRAIAVLSD